MLRISEIFQTIQGESTYAGLPCVFIRLSGCNLRCKYCDTIYALGEGRRMMTINQIMECVDGYAYQLVELTGGEPLLQKEVYDLINNLLKNKYQVLLDSNGSIDLSEVDKRVIKLIDFKCPGSGESEKNIFRNLKYITDRDEIKFVITDKKDYLWAKDILKKHCVEQKVIFSPVEDKIQAQTLTNWILEDKLNVRLGIQLHKYIGIR